MNTSKLIRNWGSAAAFGLGVFFLSSQAMAFEGAWVGLVQDESETPECVGFVNSSIKAAIRDNRFYGWAQIGDTWHRVSGRVDANGEVTGHISAAEALDSEAVPSRSVSRMRFSMQIDGTVAAGNWAAPDGCSGELTAYQP